MEQLISFFFFDIYGVIILSALFVILLVQLFFYFVYYKKPHSYYNNPSYESDSTVGRPSVSVVIIAKNESENLANNLPSILKQNYPDYEVIVVNDGSTDESENVLKALKLEYPQLYSTFAPEPPYENDKNKQKLLSMTIGIKAATKDVLLFTEADTVPFSENWISSMMGRLTSSKDIVLGYCRYNAHKGWWSKFALFDNLLFTLQYMSMAIKGKPYTGIYRNIAYRKQLFFDNKGFSSSLNYDNAEDIFLNNIMTADNTAVALSESGFVSSEMNTFSIWGFQKTNFIRAKSHFKNFKPNIFHVETFSRYLFYLTSIAGIVYSSLFSLWAYLGGAVLLFLIRYFVQFLVLKKASIHLDTKKFALSLPIMDLIQPFYNFSFWRDSKKKAKK